MTTSVVDLFKLGVGPSSSHTMGPMTAANRFLDYLGARGVLAGVVRVETTLYGSLALTGAGHATDQAVILGLAGFAPASLDPDVGEAAVVRIRAESWLTLGAGGPGVGFDERRDIVWSRGERQPQHPNALRFVAFDAGERRLAARE